MSKFKVGNRVKLRKDSQYAYQSNVRGTVVKDDGDCYKVNWDDESHNYYEDKDLKYAKIENWRERIR